MAKESTIKQLEQILAKRQKYTVKTEGERRDLDAVNGVVGDIIKVLGTLINDLKKQGILE
jgi:hypothetical protein